LNSIDFKIGIGCGVGDGISREVLVKALESGIRYFDTSSFYSVGILNQLDNILNELSIDRETVHLSLKLWITDLGINRTTDWNAHEMSLRSIHDNILRKFNVSRFDSLVIHWPLKVDDIGLPDEFRIEEVWPQLEELVYAGYLSHIGVSNFNIIDMQRLISIARIKPYSAQIEFNPFANNMALVAYCQGQGVHVIGHSPFHFGWSNGQLELFADPIIKMVSAKHNRPPAQVVLSWMMRFNIIPIPGTTKVDHVDDFIAAIDDAYLDDEDIRAINSLNNNRFNYFSLFDHFNLGHHKKYFSNETDLNVLIFTGKGDTGFRSVSLYDAEFLANAKQALTVGAGFVILPGFLKSQVRALKQVVATSDLESSARWDGGGDGLKNILNSGKEILEIADDPLLALIVESLLGWDCKLDNIALSTSRTAPDNHAFGPHQDSPFDHYPGAPLPPPSYPTVLQCIVAVDEFTEENGSLYVIPGSHKKQQRVNLPWHGNLAPGIVPEGALKAVCPEGSVIIAVGHIWHGSFPNMSDEPRMGLLVEFVLSICEATHKSTSGTVSENLINNCSKRVVRLLNNGSIAAIGPSIALAFNAVHESRIEPFAKKDR
jgi:diketogulonate reductase-like aldo/keto reductase